MLVMAEMTAEELHEWHRKFSKRWLKENRELLEAMQ